MWPRVSRRSTQTTLAGGPHERSDIGDCARTFPSPGCRFAHPGCACSTQLVLAGQPVLNCAIFWLARTSCYIKLWQASSVFSSRSMPRLSTRVTVKELDLVSNTPTLRGVFESPKSLGRRRWHTAWRCSLGLFLFRIEASGRNFIEIQDSENCTCDSRYQNS